MFQSCVCFFRVTAGLVTGWFEIKSFQTKKIVCYSDDSSIPTSKPDRNQQSINWVEANPSVRNIIWIERVGQTMPSLPPMTGNGYHPTFKHGDLGDGLSLFLLPSSGIYKNHFRNLSATSNTFSGSRVGMDSQNRTVMSARGEQVTH